MTADHVSLSPPQIPCPMTPTDPVAISLPVPFVFELFPKIRNYPIQMNI